MQVWRPPSFPIFWHPPPPLPAIAFLLLPPLNSDATFQIPPPPFPEFQICYWKYKVHKLISLYEHYGHTKIQTCQRYHKVKLNSPYVISVPVKNWNITRIDSIARFFLDPPPPLPLSCLILKTPSPPLMGGRHSCMTPNAENSTLGACQGRELSDHNVFYRFISI